MSINVKFSDSSFELFEFPAHSFNHGVSMPLTYSEDRRHNPSGSPVFQDMLLARHANPLSPLLNLLCAKGQFIEEIRISVSHGKDVGHSQEQNQSDDAKNKYEYVLKKCLLTSVSVGGGSDTPMEQLTISFQHITWNYVTTKKIVTTADWSVVVPSDDTSEI